MSAGSPKADRANPTASSVETRSGVGCRLLWLKRLGPDTSVLTLTRSTLLGTHRAIARACCQLPG